MYLVVHAELVGDECESCESAHVLAGPVGVVQVLATRLVALLAAVHVLREGRLDQRQLRGGGGRGERRGG